MFLTMIENLIANDMIFNLEGQGIIGYHDKTDKLIYYSDSQKSEMQKPSLGFDYLLNISNSNRNIGSFSLQYRLAWNENGNQKFEHQFYNAFFKYKGSIADLSIGHIKPAFGFNSYTDNHALLLHNFSMHGMGYDRDWGASLYKEFDKSNLNVSATLGSGMPFYIKDNYLVAGRYGYGYINEENYTFGVSLFHGENLDTHGYHLMNDHLMTSNYLGLDGRYLWNYFESNVDIILGKKENTNIKALMFRQTLNLMEENKLKFDIQPVWVKSEGNDNLKLALGVSYRLHPDITLRTLFEHDYDANDNYAIFQIYFYKNIFTGSL